MVVIISSLSSPLPSVLWEPLTISAMPASPGVLGAEGSVGIYAVAGSTNPLPWAALTRQGRQQMPGLDAPALPVDNGQGDPLLSSQSVVGSLSCKPPETRARRP